MSDARIQAAIDHWAPRYVENGVPVGDFLEVTSAIDSWDEWCAAWCRVGEVHEEAGDEALAAGRRRSAADHLVTAAVCYHFGKFLFVHDLDQMRSAHRRAVAAHRKAHPLMRPPAERVVIPYRGSHLVGNLRKPPAPEPAPVVVMIPGLDSAKEELTSNETHFLERGMATFTMDGPGQGEAEYDLPIEPHYEAPLAAVVDTLEARDDVDMSRLGAWGVSMGGYYVVRAAAFESRIAAAISLSGPFSFLSMWNDVPPMTRAAFRVRSHSADDGETAAKLAAIDLGDVIGQVTCPLYVVGGDRDRIVPPEAARQIAAGVSGPCVVNVVAGGNHVASNKAYLYRPQSADWMAEQLGVASGGGEGTPT